MDPQFQELAGEIAEAVEKRLSGAFEESFKAHIDQFEHRAEQSFKTQIDQFEQRAELRMQMHFENLETKVTLAAEGYGSTLEKIERELVALNKKVDDKFADHDVVLLDHNKRLTELEKPRG